MVLKVKFVLPSKTNRIDRYKDYLFSFYSVRIMILKMYWRCSMPTVHMGQIATWIIYFLFYQGEWWFWRWNMPAIQRGQTSTGIIYFLFMQIIIDLKIFFFVPQLYLWGSPLLGEIFAYVTVFNPTIKVVTFRLRGWCVLGVFLLPAFTRLGHERQDLLSRCDEMHVCTD